MEAMNQNAKNHREIAAFIKMASEESSDEKLAYIDVLKSMPPDRLNKYLLEGGWVILNKWLVQALLDENHEIICELLMLLLMTPIDLYMIKGSTMRLIKDLSSLRKDDPVTILANRVACHLRFMVCKYGYDRILDNGRVLGEEILKLIGGALYAEDILATTWFMMDFRKMCVGFDERVIRETVMVEGECVVEDPIVVESPCVFDDPPIVLGVTLVEYPHPSMFDGPCPRLVDDIMKIDGPKVVLDPIMVERSYSSMVEDTMMVDGRKVVQHPIMVEGVPMDIDDDSSMMKDLKVLVKGNANVENNEDGKKVKEGDAMNDDADILKNVHKNAKNKGFANQVIDNNCKIIEHVKFVDGELVLDYEEIIDADKNVKIVKHTKNVILTRDQLRENTAGDKSPGSEIWDLETKKYVLDKNAKVDIAEYRRVIERDVKNNDVRLMINDNIADIFILLLKFSHFIEVRNMYAEERNKAYEARLGKMNRFEYGVDFNFENKNVSQESNSENKIEKLSKPIFEIDTPNTTSVCELENKIENLTKCNLENEGKDSPNPAPVCEFKKKFEDLTKPNLENKEKHPQNFPTVPGIENKNLKEDVSNKIESDCVSNKVDNNQQKSSVPKMDQGQDIKDQKVSCDRGKKLKNVKEDVPKNGLKKMKGVQNKIKNNRQKRCVPKGFKKDIMSMVSFDSPDSDFENKVDLPKPAFEKKGKDKSEPAFENKGKSKSAPAFENKDKDKSKPAFENKEKVPQNFPTVPEIENKNFKGDLHVSDKIQNESTAKKCERNRSSMPKQEIVSSGLAEEIKNIKEGVPQNEPKKKKKRNKGAINKFKIFRENISVQKKSQKRYSDVMEKDMVRFNSSNHGSCALENKGRYLPNPAYENKYGHISNPAFENKHGDLSNSAFENKPVYDGSNPELYDTIDYQDYVRALKEQIYIEDENERICDKNLCVFHVNARDLICCNARNVKARNKNQSEDKISKIDGTKVGDGDMDQISKPSMVLDVGNSYAEDLQKNVSDLAIVKHSKIADDMNRNLRQFNDDAKTNRCNEVSVDKINDKEYENDTMKNYLQQGDKGPANLKQDEVDARFSNDTQYKTRRTLAREEFMKKYNVEDIPFEYEKYIRSLTYNSIRTPGFIDDKQGFDSREYHIAKEMRLEDVLGDHGKVRIHTVGENLVDDIENSEDLQTKSSEKYRENADSGSCKPDHNKRKKKNKNANKRNKNYVKNKKYRKDDCSRNQNVNLESNLPVQDTQPAGTQYVVLDAPMIARSIAFRTYFENYVTKVLHTDINIVYKSKELYDSAKYVFYQDFNISDQLKREFEIGQYCRMLDVYKDENQYEEVRYILKKQFNMHVEEDYANRVINGFPIKYDLFAKRPDPPKDINGVYQNVKEESVDAKNTNKFTITNPDFIQTFFQGNLKQEMERNYVRIKVIADMNNKTLFLQKVSIPKNPYKDETKFNKEDTSAYETCTEFLDVESGFSNEQNNIEYYIPDFKAFSAEVRSEVIRNREELFHMGVYDRNMMDETYRMLSVNENERCSCPQCKPISREKAADVIVETGIIKMLREAFIEYSKNAQYNVTDSCADDDKSDAERRNDANDLKVYYEKRIHEGVANDFNDFNDDEKCIDEDEYDDSGEDECKDIFRTHGYHDPGQLDSLYEDFKKHQKNKIADHKARMGHHKRDANDENQLKNVNKDKTSMIRNILEDMGFDKELTKALCNKNINIDEDAETSDGIVENNEDIDEDSKKNYENNEAINENSKTSDAIDETTEGIDEDVKTIDENNEDANKNDDEMNENNEIEKEKLTRALKKHHYYHRKLFDAIYARHMRKMKTNDEIVQGRDENNEGEDIKCEDGAKTNEGFKKITCEDNVYEGYENIKCEDGASEGDENIKGEDDAKENEGDIKIKCENYADANEDYKNIKWEDDASEGDKNFEGQDDAKANEGYKKIKHEDEIYKGYENIKREDGAREGDEKVKREDAREGDKHFEDEDANEVDIKIKCESDADANEDYKKIKCEEAANEGDKNFEGQDDAKANEGDENIKCKDDANEGDKNIQCTDKRILRERTLQDGEDLYKVQKNKRFEKYDNVIGVVTAESKIVSVRKSTKASRNRRNVIANKENEVKPEENKQKIQEYRIKSVLKKMGYRGEEYLDQICMDLIENVKEDGRNDMINLEDHGEDRIKEILIKMGYPDKTEFRKRKKMS